MKNLETIYEIKHKFKVVCPYENCLKRDSPKEETMMMPEGEVPKAKLIVKYKCGDCGKRFIYVFAEGRDKPEIQKFTGLPKIDAKPEEQAEKVDFDEVIKSLSVEVQNKIPTGGEYKRGSLLEGLKLGG